MGRIRTIKPEFPQSESVGRLSRDARLLFILLWTLVDDAGRCRGGYPLLASLLYPYDRDAARKIKKWLQELEDHGHIRRYEVSGSAYLDVPKWSEHQKISHPAESKIPPPPEDSGGFRRIPEDSGESPSSRAGAGDARLQNPPVSRARAGLGSGSGSGSGPGEDVRAREADSQPDAAPNVINLWREKWEARWPDDILRHSPADVSTLEADAATLGGAEISARMDRYFASDRKAIVTRKHPLRFFVRDIAEYAAAAKERSWMDDFVDEGATS